MDFDPSTIEWDDKLSPLDYAMYRADMDPRSRTTVMTVETLDVCPDWERLRTDIDRATRLIPRLRQKVVAPLVPVTDARWVFDPDFDLDYHFQRVVLPGTADMRSLLDFAQQQFGAPLDPNRPLWELILCETPGMPEADAALIWKMSHTVTDGIGGMLMDLIVRHDERDPELGPMPTIPAPDDVDPLDMTRKALRRLPVKVTAANIRRLKRVAGLAKNAISDPSGAAEGATRAVGSLTKPFQTGDAKPSPLLAGRGLKNRFEMLHFPLSDLRDAAKAHDCSVNDAYLAAICGGLRRYHDGCGSPVDHVALGMPINIRPADAADSTDNQWSAATIAAPVGIEDPVERMKRIHEIVLSARSDTGANPMTLIAPILSWIPQPLLASLSGGASIGLDVQASNVPGHPGPRFVGGAEITRSIPIGPTPGVAIMVTMLSLNRKCSVGINYDTAAITDQDLFMQCMTDGFDEVFALGRAKPGKNKSAAKKAGKKS